MGPVLRSSTCDEKLRRSGRGEAIGAKVGVNGTVLVNGRRGVLGMSGTCAAEVLGVGCWNEDAGVSVGVATHSSPRLGCEGCDVVSML